MTHTTLREVMTPDPISVAIGVPVREALEILEGGTIRHLPVIDGDRVVGMLSDHGLWPWRKALLAVRDRKGTATTEEMLRRPVEAFMRDDVLFLDVGRPVVDAIDVMLDFKVGAVPVVEEGKLAGIVTWVDLLELLKEKLVR